MNQELAKETLKELTQLQRNIDEIISMVDEDADESEVVELFVKRFYHGSDFTMTCSKAKGLISSMINQ